MEKYFLGANSAIGFYSLYDGFCADRGDFLHLIKGGPGCGKSGFMRRIAEAAEKKGLEVEYVLCSGDPDSLDGIYIPELKVGYADATAPHVIEPRHFGADSDYVNLGQFCTRAPSDEIGLYTAKYKAYYDRAYSLLSAAGAVKTAPYPELIDGDVITKVDHRAGTAVRRALGAPCGSGKVKKCFIRAISCMGELVLNSSIHELCKLTCVLDDRFGLAKYYLECVIREAQARGDDIVICPSPLMPDTPEAVIFPAQGVCFASSDISPADLPCRHIRLDAMLSPEKLRAQRSEIKKAEKIYACIMDSAYFSLAGAKHWHDELEKAYRPYVDFDALDEFTEKEIDKFIK